MKPLGTGLVVVPKLLPFLHGTGEALSVIELEPQTIWQVSRDDGLQHYHLNVERFRQVAESPHRKLLHSVGLPVGGSQPLDPAQLDLIRLMMETLQPPWV